MIFHQVHKNMCNMILIDDIDVVSEKSLPTCQLFSPNVSGGSLTDEARSWMQRSKLRFFGGNCGRPRVHLGLSGADTPEG